MMGSLSKESGWLETIAGVSQEHLAPERLAARRRADRLVFTRWALVVFNFERLLYADPEREDLNALWWDLVQRLQLVNPPLGGDEPDWAAKIHVAVAPVYYHNYVLGNLISAQLRDHLESHITRGPFYENEVAGRYLVEAFFGSGARANWQDTVLQATGEPLSTRHFVGEIS